MSIAATAYVCEIEGKLEFVGALMDVTAVKEAEGKIRLAEEALRPSAGGSRTRHRVTTMGELTASLHNEVNQPLSAIARQWSRLPTLALSGSALTWPGSRGAERIVRDGQDAEKLCGGVRALFQASVPGEQGRP